MFDAPFQELAVPDEERSAEFMYIRCTIARRQRRFAAKAVVTSSPVWPLYVSISVYYT